jgi:hypothetical protein
MNLGKIGSIIFERKKMAKRAIVTGIKGHGGTYMAELPVSKCWSNRHFFD